MPSVRVITLFILILALLSAGCTDKGGSSVQTTTSDTYPTVEPTVTVVPEAHWWEGKPGFHDAEVGTYSTLFGDDISGVINSMSQPGNYNIFDIDSPDLRFEHQEYPSFDPYKDL